MPTARKRDANCENVAALRAAFFDLGELMSTVCHVIAFDGSITVSHFLNIIFSRSISCEETICMVLISTRVR